VFSDELRGMGMHVISCALTSVRFGQAYWDLSGTGKTWWYHAKGADE